jgi:hypothetical protein
MRTQSIFAGVVFALLISAAAAAQDVRVAPNAPKDKPLDAEAEQVRAIEEAIKPHVETARKTYPEARERFLKGLPPEHTFFVTTRLRDSTGRFEQVFVAVREIKGGRISGRIWSNIQLVSGYKLGDPYTFPESELFDWTISRPDGTEEGNFVGKFLDTYQPITHVTGDPEWNDKPVTPAKVSQRIEEAAVQYEAQAPIPRVVFYDIAYPRDEREYAALNGYAVMLTTALSQERSELPLKRVYVSAGGKEIELKVIKQVLSEQKAGGGASAKTFGAFRADTLYLLPMYLRTEPGDLMVDFAANRTGFKMATLGTPLSDEISKLPVKAPAAAGPPDKVLEDFVRREFPSFF